MSTSICPGKECLFDVNEPCLDPFKYTVIENKSANETNFVADG